jgi:hypothetical protein
LTVEVDWLPESSETHADLAPLHDRVRDVFLEYADLLSEFTGESSGVDLPDDAHAISYAVADALQIADSLKQRLLETRTTTARLSMELRFLERLIPQLRELLERRESELRARRERGEDDAHRNEQTRYFGKYFSLN